MKTRRDYTIAEIEQMRKWGFIAICKDGVVAYFKKEKRD